MNDTERRFKLALEKIRDGENPMLSERYAGRAPEDHLAEDVSEYARRVLDGADPEMPSIHETRAAR